MNTKEEDMYNPIKNVFNEKGYEVYGEVKNCDIVCINKKIAEDIIIIEMKKNLNIKLLSQGIERKKITSEVYIAYNKPKKFTLKKRQEVLRICKGLELGVILINKKEVNIILEPKSLTKKINIKKRNQIKKELEGRNLNINKGGSSRKKINTSFREKNIFISCCLESLEKSKGCDLIKAFNTPKDTTQIMYKNIYQWYERTGKGTYTLNEKGRKELHSKQFKEVYDYYKEIVKEKM